MLVVSLATWLALGRMTVEATVNARRVARLLMAAAMAIAFMVMFFTGADVAVRPNVFSRLLDVPYYGLLALAAMTLASSPNRATVMIGTGVLIVRTVVPLVGNQWPSRWLAAARGC